MSILEEHQAQESYTSEWLAGTLRWEINLRALRVQYQSALTCAACPDLRAVPGPPGAPDLQQREPRIDRVA